MLQFFKTARASAPNADNTSRMYLFIDDAGILCTKDNTGVSSPIQGANTTTFTADVTTARAFLTSDIGKVVVYNSASNGNFSIPNDTTLGLSGSDNAEIQIYQKGTGRPDIVAGSGVTFNVWSGYPSSAQFVTQVIHRVGPNTWAVK